MKIVRRIRKKFLLKLFVVLAVVGVFCFFSENIAVKLLIPIAKSQIEQYTGSEVEIGSIEVGLNGLVELKGMVVSSCLDDASFTPLLVAKTVQAEFPFSSFLKLRPRLRSLTVDDFVLDVRYDQDLSSWNIAFFERNDDARNNKTVPALVLRGGTVRLSKVQGGVPEKIFSMSVKNGSIVNFEGKKGLGFEFEINPSSSGHSGFIGGELQQDKKSGIGSLIINSKEFSTGSEPIFGNVWQVRNMHLDLNYDQDNLMVNSLAWEMGDRCRFSLSGKVTDYKHECNYIGQMNVENMFVNDKAKGDSLVYDEGLSENIGRHLRGFLALYTPRGVCDFDFKAEGQFGDLAKSLWSGTVTCKDLSIQHSKFPYLLEHMTGKVNLTPDSIDFSELKCKHNDVVFDITGGIKKLDALKVTDIIISTENLLLGNDIYRALTKKQQSIWYTFTPKGIAKIKYKFFRRHDQKKGTAELEIEMAGGEADYLHFPYHLENITGRVIIGPEKVELINLVSTSDDSSITLNGNVTHISSKKPRYKISIDAKNIPLDSRLKAALPYSQRSFFDSFKLTARTDVKIEIFPNEVGRRPVEYTAEVSIKDAFLMYEDFPLPLIEVNVDAILTPDGTFLEKLTGTNGNGTVEISGKVWPENETYSGPGYCLELKASNIQVQDRWLKSLPAGSYKILSKLNPEGAIDVDAKLSFNPRTKCEDFRIVVESQGGSISYSKIPYKIDNIYGQVIIEKDRISLDNIRAAWPETRSANGGQEKSIAVNGIIVLDNNFFKSAKFSLLAENIDFDKKLGNALKGFSGDFYTDLKPSGRFDLEINDIICLSNGGRGTSVDFSSELTLKDFAVNNGNMFGGTNGRITTSGTYRTGKGLVKGGGDFDIDKIDIKGITVKDVRGDVVYDPNAMSLTCSEYTAKCYDGIVLGSLHLNRQKNRDVKYAVETIFSKINLNGLITPEMEFEKDASYSKGLVSGYFTATGIFDDNASRVGRLNIEASKMAFAKRTFLGKLVTASQMEDPTDHIFSDVNIQSYLQKDTLFLENIEVFGKSMQMKGYGEINIKNKNTKMHFNAFGKRTSKKPSFLETLKRSLGSAVVQVEVEGKFDSPKITPTTLPIIKKPFGLFGTKDK